MKRLIIFFVFSLHYCLTGQTVKGKLIDHYGEPLMGVNVMLYIHPNAYRTLTGEDGTFTLLNVVKTESKENLPEGYYISECYPNPFNPKTRIVYQTPEAGSAKIRVFNSLGQNVADEIEKPILPGINYTDLELNGLPNGVYFANILLNGKYSVTKKLMLLYGSPHLSSSALPGINTPGNRLDKIHSYTTKADSLVVFNEIMGKKVFTDLPAISNQITDLGSLTVERYWPGLPTITYEGRVYNTVKIGNQCWLRENLDVGTLIPSSQDQTDNGIVEKYSYKDDPSYLLQHGGLYKWDEAMGYSKEAGTRGICPPGFHIPTIEEIRTLAQLLNYESRKLIARGHGGNYYPGNNMSGFNAFFSGARNSFTFFGLGSDAKFWSSCENTATSASFLNFSWSDNLIFLYYWYKVGAVSIRCIKDN